MIVENLEMECTVVIGVDGDGRDIEVIREGMQKVDRLRHDYPRRLERARVTLHPSNEGGAYFAITWREPLAS